eukprot:TRINITY_DN967_c0_g1_i1.p1 TRINITY_DN967_c0_g1~~TRINITY_DN967_c0_g1_i1.p1  ORF type:complete len:137 (-),score=23.10 TRINITY_DN967_c0_g1_i1:28-405(-)
MAEIDRTTIHVAGFGWSPHFKRAREVANLLSTEFPDLFEADVSERNRQQYFDWLNENRPKFSSTFEPNDKGETVDHHKTSPIVWISKGGKNKFVGGRDRLCEWTIANHPASKAAKRAGERVCNIM